MKQNEETRYLFWLSQHGRELRKYSGQWVGIKLGKGVVVASKSLKQAHRNFLKRYPHEKPHLFQVPEKGEHFYILLSL